MEQQESTRQLKVGRQIQRDLAEILQQQGMNTYNGAMITVTSVRMSPDLALARVWVSIFPSHKTPDVLEVLRKQVKTIRRELGRRVATCNDDNPGIPPGMPAFPWYSLCDFLC